MGSNDSTVSTFGDWLGVPRNNNNIGMILKQTGFESELADCKVLNSTHISAENKKTSRIH